MNIGIDQNDLIRIGGKANAFCDQFSLHNMARKHSQPARSRAHRQHIASLFSQRDRLHDSLGSNFNTCSKTRVTYDDVLTHLQVDYEDYAAAFELPEPLEGEFLVGRNGRPVKADSLLVRWANGQDAGWYAHEPNVREASNIWNMPWASRKAKLAQWKAEIQKD